MPQRHIAGEACAPDVVTKIEVVAVRCHLIKGQRYIHVSLVYRRSDLAADRAIDGDGIAERLADEGEAILEMKILGHHAARIQIIRCRFFSAFEINSLFEDSGCRPPGG